MMRYAVLILAALVAAPGFSKQPVELAEDAWIVVLEEAPMVRFEGALPAVQSTGGSGRQALLPTAPSVTGAPRLEIDTPAARAYTDYLRTRRQAVLSEAGARLGRAVEPVHVYELLVNGFSVRMSAAEARELATMPGVSEVRPVEIHRPLLDTGPGLVGADRLWSGAVDGSAYRGEGRVIGIIDTGINWDSPYFSDQVPGYTFTNPYGTQLGECSRVQVRCNNKLVGVYDFTSEGTRGGDIDGHGSHVASIAAGNPVDFEGAPTSGMAPRANIISYKVCVEDDDEPGSICLNDAIQAALEQAVANGVDVVNYSIGGGPNDPWTSSSAQSFLNLLEAGIVPVAAAGNEGPDPGTIKTPANAPWVIGVGNSTHGRLFGNRVDAAGLTHLVSVLGNGPAPAADITAPIRDAAVVAPGNGLGCAAFPSGSFAGAIALIQRGDCFFSEKVDHAAAAGAVAVLVFNHEGGLPLTMDMQGGTDIPATMISRDDGLAVRAAMAASNAPEATIFAATEALFDPRRANLMAAGSSRGPNPFAARVMKPNLVAPGSHILGAGAQGADEFNTISGTSMAAPFVAGAAALVLQANPGWTPMMVKSALTTTADQSAVRNHDGGAADITARGAGLLQVDDAAAAGLYLNVTPSEFRNARPPAGDPAQLNLSGLVASGCAQGCDFTRRLTALTAGTWNVETAGEVEIEVSPSSFSLAAGDSVTLQMTVTVADNTVGTWADGAIRLVPAGAQLPVQKLTVGVEIDPLLDIDAAANRGRVQATIAGVPPLAEAIVRTSALTRPETTTRLIPQDPDPDEPYDGSAGTSVIWLEVPEDTAMLYVETLPSTARDVDIFVGRDDDGIDQPVESSERCRGISPDDLELCVIAQPAAGRWWVLVQNWQSSPGAGADTITVRTAIVPESNDPTLAATAAGVHAGGALPVRVAWDHPPMQRAETWIGAVSISDAVEPGAPRVVPVKLRREAALAAAHKAIIPGGGTMSVAIPAGGVHDRLFVDVPASQDYLYVSLRGNDVEASLAYLEFDALADSEPLTPPAPDQRVAGPVVLSGGEHTSLALTGDDLAPGRYYVVLEDLSSQQQERVVEIYVAFDEIAIDPPPGELHPEPRMGLWAPRNRGTGQGISWDRAGWGFITWYTYEEDGSPVFYLAAGPVNPGSPVWFGELDRTTSASDTRQQPERVGRVMLTALDEDDLIFSWQLLGAHGSERMFPLASNECRDGESLTGLWLVPERTFGGTTVVVNPETRAYLRYYFDALGLPRWLITGDELGDDTLQALEWRGFCPYCDAVEPTVEEVGTYRIDFSGETDAREVIDAVLGAPVDFDFQFDHPVEKFSDRMDCL